MSLYLFSTFANIMYYKQQRKFKKRMFFKGKITTLLDKMVKITDRDNHVTKMTSLQFYFC